jgi:hypothetical protein
MTRCARHDERELDLASIRAGLDEAWLNGLPGEVY